MTFRAAGAQRVCCSQPVIVEDFLPLLFSNIVGGGDARGAGARGHRGDAGDGDGGGDGAVERDDAVHGRGGGGSAGGRLRGEHRGERAGDGDPGVVAVTVLWAVAVRGLLRGRAETL